MLQRYVPPWDDGIAWAVAAVVLLAAVFLAGTPVPVAILLSVVAYGGLALARAPERRGATAPHVMSDEAALRIASDRIAALRGLRRDVRDEVVRDWIGSFTDRSSAILTVIAEDRKLRAAPLFLQGIIAPADDLLREYARLEGRGVQSAIPILERIRRENLPLIDQATAEFYEQLHRTDVAEIDTLSERLEYNLSDRLPAIARGDR